MDKKDYVRGQAKRNTTFDHHCHWPGCPKSVPPAMWGCYKHWMKLPKRLRDAIWETYEPGQEQTKEVSSDYLTVADEVQKWIAQNGSP